MSESGVRVYWQGMDESMKRIETDREKNAELGARSSTGERIGGGLR